MTGAVVSGGPAWPRWLPWMGVRVRALDAAECIKIGVETGAVLEPGNYRELAVVWLDRELSFAPVPRAGAAS